MALEGDGDSDSAGQWQPSVFGGEREAEKCDAGVEVVRAREGRVVGPR